MSDELIWRREAPFQIKFPILLGVYVARIMACFFGYLFVDTFITFTFGLFAPLGCAKITFLTNRIYTFDGNQYTNIRLTLSLILTLLHACCATGLRHHRTYAYAKVLIYLYAFLLLITSCIRSIPFVLILLLLLGIWCFSLYGLRSFRYFCDEYIEEHRIKNPDPYGLLSSFPGNEVPEEIPSSSKSFYECYGNDLIDPIKVDLGELPSVKNVPKDTNESHKKSYF